MSTDNTKFTHDEREICLFDHLPEIYQRIHDFRAMANVSCSEIKPLYDGLDLILNDIFIESASSEILARWERYLKITPNATDTLEERRFRILAKLNDSPPYTDAYLEKRLNELCGEDGYRILRDYDQYQIVIQLSAGSPSNTVSVANIVREIIPANMMLTVQEYRTRHSELEKYTHEQLAVYTHDDIKYRRIDS